MDTRKTIVSKYKAEHEISSKKYLIGEDKPYLHYYGYRKLAGTPPNEYFVGRVELRLCYPDGETAIKLRFPWMGLTGFGSLAVYAHEHEEELKRALEALETGDALTIPSPLKIIKSWGNDCGCEPYTFDPLTLKKA